MHAMHIHATLPRDVLRSVVLISLQRKKHETRPGFELQLGYGKDASLPLDHTSLTIVSNDHNALASKVLKLPAWPVGGTKKKKVGQCSPVWNGAAQLLITYYLCLSAPPRVGRFKA